MKKQRRVEEVKAGRAHVLDGGGGETGVKVRGWELSLKEEEEEEVIDSVFTALAEDRKK